MHEKIKGLEDSIQAYIDKHPNCDVKVIYSRDVAHDGKRTTSEWFSWEVIVEHEATEI